MRIIRKSQNSTHLNLIHFIIMIIVHVVFELASSFYELFVCLILFIFLITINSQIVIILQVCSFFVLFYFFGLILKQVAYLSVLIIFLLNFACLNHLLKILELRMMRGFLLNSFSSSIFPNFPTLKATFTQVSNLFLSNFCCLS